MDEEQLNLSIRRFLKQVGVSSQREIEKAVRAGLRAGTLTGGETLKVSMHLELGAVGLKHDVDGEISLG